MVRSKPPKLVGWPWAPGALAILIMAPALHGLREESFYRLVAWWIEPGPNGVGVGGQVVPPTPPLVVGVANASEESGREAHDANPAEDVQPFAPNEVLPI
jgi:hypothetical protein